MNSQPRTCYHCGSTVHALQARDINDDLVCGCCALAEASAELYYTENLLEVKEPAHRERYCELRDLLGDYVNESYSSYISGWLPKDPNCPDILTLVREYGSSDEEILSWLKHLPVEVEVLRQEVVELKRDQRKWQKIVDQLGGE